MKLKSFGCSFIFGTDLRDCLADDRWQPSRKTWPALIADNFGWEYISFARPGAGNLQILEKLLCEIQHDQPAVYVIGWTYIDRFDYVNDKAVTPLPGASWSTVMPTDQGAVADCYWRNFHAEYSDKLKSLIYIQTAIDLLTKNHCSFIMTYADPLVLCNRWHTSRASSILMAKIRGYMKEFDGKTFLDWSRSRGFAVSQLAHPLEAAHRAAADLVLSDWDQYLCHSA